MVKVKYLENDGLCIVVKRKSPKCEEVVYRIYRYTTDDGEVVYLDEHGEYTKYMDNAHEQAYGAIYHDGTCDRHLSSNHNFIKTDMKGIVSEVRAISVAYILASELMPEYAENINL
jgi:hypothetical protein